MNSPRIGDPMTSIAEPGLQVPIQAWNQAAWSLATLVLAVR
jgi:hypothetical protein